MKNRVLVAGVWGLAEPAAKFKNSMHPPGGQNKSGPMKTRFITKTLYRDEGDERDKTLKQKPRPYALEPKTAFDLIPFIPFIPVK